MTARGLALAALAASLLRPLPAARTYTIRGDGVPLTTFWGVEDFPKTEPIQEATMPTTIPYVAVTTKTCPRCPRCGRTYNPMTVWHDLTIKGRRYTATVCADDMYDALILFLQERGLPMDCKEVPGE